MDEQENVDAGSDTSGEQAESAQAETTDTTAPETEKAVDAGGAADAEPKAGDACTCPDGRAGTLHDQDGTLVCLANQG
jgi:hypothetical protein